MVVSLVAGSKLVALSRTATRLRKAVRYERVAWSRTASIIPSQVFYESFSGNGMLDNPEAICAALLASPDMQHLSHVWALNDLNAYRSTVRRYKDDPRVSFVASGADGYYEALGRSQYLVNNATFPPEFGKREGQTYLNTWHGTPLKHMGYDIPGGGPATRNVVRNFVSADYLLSSSSFMTERMYESAYKLRGIYRGKIVQEGSPRIDRQFLSPSERAQLKQSLAERGLHIRPEQKIVLFAPTWRGSFYAPLNDVVQLRNLVRRLSELIGTDEYRILLKVHQRVYEFAAHEPELSDILVPNDIPTNVMLGVTDVLVTDYSSIFFDFLTTGRPILFYTPDEIAYAHSRGLYLPADELPGPVSHTVDQLAVHLRNIGSGGGLDPLVSHATALTEARQRFCPREDGRATERIVDLVFRGQTEGYDVRDGLPDSRTSILMHLGGMRSNGITKSALSLLDNIDHDRFDVSVFYADSINEDRRTNESGLNPRVRLFPRLGGINGSKFLWFGRQVMFKRGPGALSSSQRRMQDNAFHDEWVRCFGQSEFDHIVDFSGYNPFWSYILLQGKAKTRSVFLHNDLLADSQREVYGRRPHEQNLKSIFATYRRFDALISVSAALCEINRSKLASFASPEKFTYAPNTVNHQSILRMAYGDTTLSGPAMVTTNSLPEAIATVLKHQSIEAVMEEVIRRETLSRLLPERSGAITFVSAGRLSPEKNHARLIKAFGLVHQEHPSTRLVILGSGPLRADLEILVAQLGLVTAVTLAGQQSNPYSVMANADCFVLSSDYEGQPLVLLEALVLGLPIVSTDFASVRGALPEGDGVIVPRTVEGLAAGMRSYLRGEVASPKFDHVRYNHQAVQQFYQAIGADVDGSDPAVT